MNGFPGFEAVTRPPSPANQLRSRARLALARRDLLTSPAPEITFPTVKAKPGFSVKPPE